MVCLHILSVNGLTCDVASRRGYSLDKAKQLRAKHALGNNRNGFPDWSHHRTIDSILVAAIVLFDPDAPARTGLALDHRDLEEDSKFLLKLFTLLRCGKFDRVSRRCICESLA